MEPLPMTKLAQVKDSLERNFGKEFEDMSVDLNQFHSELTHRIIYLLLNDMEKLLSILYRIDVDEKKVKSAFSQNDPKQIAPLLAQYIIDREIVKIETRSKYH